MSVQTIAIDITPLFFEDAEPTKVIVGAYELDHWDQLSNKVTDVLDVYLDMSQNTQNPISLADFACFLITVAGIEHMEHSDKPFDKRRAALLRRQIGME